MAISQTSKASRPRTGQRRARAVAEGRWRGRPVASSLLRAAIFLFPVEAALLTSYFLARVMPAPTGLFVSVSWWVGLFGGSALVLVGADRLARRALPLAALLKMTMVFPERAPRRLAMARRRGRASELEAVLEEAKRSGKDSGDLAQAAEKILALAQMLDHHDKRTRGHSERVRVYADLIAEEMGISHRGRDKLRWAALLHDVGKVSVDIQVLNKPRMPDENEWEHIRRHTTEGARLVEPLMPWLGDWGRAINEHHERWDGSGYPNGLKGEEISLSARIVAVADTYETITSARPYKKPLSPSVAREEVAKGAGTDFDPRVCRALMSLSISHLRKTAGVLAWLLQLPFPGVFERVVNALTVVAHGAGSAAAAVGATAALVVGGVLHAPSDVKPRPPSVHRSESSTPAPQTLEPTPVVTEVPTAAPSAPSQVSRTPAPVVAPAPVAEVTAISRTLYLGSDPADGKPWLSLEASRPSQTTVADYDADGLAGLTIERTSGPGSDGDRQLWGYHASTDVKVAGHAKLTLWGSMAPDSGSKGHLQASLGWCTGDCTSVTSIGQSSIQEQDWPAGDSWRSATLDFGDVDAIVPAGAWLRLEVRVSYSSSGSMLFAFDTSSNRSALSLS